MEKHTSRTESKGFRLVKSLEIFRGGTLNIVPKNLGFNGISVTKDGETRHIEIKTIETGGDWFAVNGTRAIEKLVFDPTYWFYFVLFPEEWIVTVSALAYMKKEVLPEGTEDISDLLRAWILLGEGITKRSGLKIIPRVNFKVRTPIRDLLFVATHHGLEPEWKDTRFNAWQYLSEEGWKCVVNLEEQHGR